MPDYKKNIGRFCLRTAALLTFSFFLCFCVFTIANFLRPRLTSNYVLAASEEKGEYMYKTKGALQYLGEAVDLCVGGNFTNALAVAGTISGNFSYDSEQPSYIEDMPLAEKKNQEQVLEKTVSSGGGKTSAGERITINNETSYTVSADAIAASAPAFEIAEKKNTPRVLIVHSHATESYAPTDKYNFNHTSEDRTTDKNYNMVRIGAELKKELEKKDIESVHIKDLFDYPEYNNSYARSCAAVEKVLKENPSIQIVLDLHRDSIINSQGIKTKLTTTINGEKVAQVMLVVGTDELGLRHDNWKTNLKFAADFQKCLLSEEENFARPINLRTSRFNGHTAPGAVIVEVGTGANTIEEALASVKYIANAVEKLINSYD